MVRFAMKFGVVFPQTEIGTDPEAIRAFAQAAEDLGFHHILAYDHVLGAKPRGGEWLGYTHEDMFHEILVLLGYLAAVTTRIELTTGILILPQRQTALVAKQAAEIDVLSGGRLRLGIGVGWNSVEYEVLGERFEERGRRVEEQITVLRELWTKPLVNFTGRYHRIVDAGLNPLPVQRPIPIWMGGESEPVMRRIARVGDGWILGGTLRSPHARHPQVEGGFPGMVEKLRGFLRDAGRPETAVGLERRVAYPAGPAKWAGSAEEWRRLGGTHLSLSTMNAGLATPDAHIEAMRRFREALHELFRGGRIDDILAERRGEVDLVLLLLHQDPLDVLGDRVQATFFPSGGKALTPAEDTAAMVSSALTLLSPIARRLPAYSRLAWALLRDRRLPLRHRALIVGGIAYLLSPIDLIPGIIPLLGQMDDLAVTLLSLRAVLRRIAPEIAAEHMMATGLSREVIDADLRTLNSTGRLLSKTALRFGWRAAGRTVRGIAQLGRALLQRRAG